MEKITQMSTKLHYLYVHTRLDTNEVFYIGIGTSLHPNSPTISHKYSRAYAKSNRSKWWKSIVNKTEYKIDILEEGDNYEMIQNKEKGYIAYYGRKDVGEGNLVNMTDGGEGVINRVYTMAEETKLRLSDIRSIPIYCYYDTGKFFRSFKGIKEASQILNIYQNNISTAFEYTGYAKGYFFFKEYKGEDLGYKYDPNKVHTNAKTIYAYKDGEFITTYESQVEAASKLGVKRESIKQALIKGNKCKGYSLYYKDESGNLIIKEQKPKYSSKVEIILT